jgi:hypothetical protein
MKWGAAVVDCTTGRSAGLGRGRARGVVPLKMSVGCTQAVGFLLDARAFQYIRVSDWPRTYIGHLLDTD